MVLLCWVLVEAMAQGDTLGLRGQELEPCIAGSKDEADCWSNIGLARAAEAESEPEKQMKSGLLLTAAAAFAKALQLRPEWGGAANNLAQVYASLGRDAEAKVFFEKAVSSDAPLRPYYRRNYGDFLARLGAWELAAKQYRSAVEEARGDRQAHDSLVAILSRGRPEALLDYLSFLIDRGQTLWAEEVALEKLGEGGLGEENYLTTFVMARAGQSYPSEEFSLTRAAGILKDLTSRPDVGEGAIAILRLHEGNDFNPSSYQWWSERGAASGGGGPSPRQAFRRLIRSLGEAQAKVERFDSAREYFRLAILLTREEPDLEAFRMMISLPSAIEDVATVDRLADWNEAAVQTGAKQDDLKLYRHDLGLFYGFLKHWKGEGPASGIYQLSQAIRMGGVGPPGGPPDTPTFDARIYTRLAAGYSDTGKPERARKTLFDLVEAYRSRGMNDEADAMQAMLISGRSQQRPLDRRREFLDDPPVSLRDFTTGPPRPPQ
jgi:tetratricopeptide (TPR) repeat protein